MKKKILSTVLVLGLVFTGIFAQGSQDSGAEKSVAGMVWYGIITAIPL